MESKEAMENAHSKGITYDKNGEGYWKNPESGKVITLSQLLGNLSKN